MTSGTITGFLGVLVASLALLQGATCQRLHSGKSLLSYALLEDGGYSYNLTYDGKLVMAGLMDMVRYDRTGKPKESYEDLVCDSKSCHISNAAKDNVFGMRVMEGERFEITWWTDQSSSWGSDCVELFAGSTDPWAWYGGPESWQENWPIQDTKTALRPYLTTRKENGAVAERYWLNSEGGYIFVEDNAPLYVDRLLGDYLCFVTDNADPYVGRENGTSITYYLGGKSNPRDAHLAVVNDFLGKPKAPINEWVVRHPIWTTWAKYKKEISDEVVVNFAKDIADHGFIGQLEIDDFWETCYGDLVFNENFSGINETVAQLKEMNFTVTLWVHPFVNDECNETVDYARQNDFFMKDVNGYDTTNWWDGFVAHHVNFSNPNARNWFADRLKMLQKKHGIDAFKFDAGESDWAPIPFYPADPTQIPNTLTSDYVNMAAEFGDLVEVRSAWRSQNLPVMLRMLDKDSRWGLDNGLHSLITTLLKFNIQGYTLVLPDMIGGNGYDQLPTPELLVRWTQANTFMPVMQFSYLPWDITSDQFDSEGIVKKFVKLHEDYADKILAAMQASVDNGTPVNPPIWWVDPENADLRMVNDEYLLGEDILVAPVIEEGKTGRDIILPAGTWLDANTNATYKGPTVLKMYPAPIDVLPYFIKQNE